MNWQNKDTKSIFRNQRYFCTPTIRKQTKIRKKIPFDIATRKIKYLGINLTNEAKDLYSENYTTLNEEIKEDTNKRKHVSSSFLEEFTSSKCPYTLKQFIDSM